MLVSDLDRVLTALRRARLLLVVMIAAELRAPTAGGRYARDEHVRWDPGPTRAVIRDGARRCHGRRGGGRHASRATLDEVAYPRSSASRDGAMLPPVRLPAASVLVAAMLALCTMCTPAVAAPVAEQEPNDDLTTAVGPMVSGQAYAGTVSANDVDTYIVYSADKSGRIVLTTSSPECRTALVATETDLDRGYASSSSTWAPNGSEGADAPLDDTFSFQAHLYVYRVTAKTTASCTTAPYELTATIEGDAAPPPYPTPNAPMVPLPVGDAPHDSLLTTGPALQSGVNYGGTFQVAGQVRWYEFAVSPGKTAYGLLTRLGPKCADANDGGLIATVTNGGGVYPVSNESAWARDGEAADHFATVRRDDHDERFYVSVTSGCAGSQFRLSFGPAGVGAGSPTPFAAIGPSPTPVIITAGPVVMVPGVVYQRTMTTTVDSDLFRVRLTGSSEQAAVVYMNGSFVCKDEFSVRASNDDLNINTGSIKANTRRSSGIASPVPVTASLRAFGGCAGHTYQVAVTPGPAVTGPAPPPPVVKSGAVKISLKRRGKVYSGRMTATYAACVKHRSVRIVNKRARTVARVRTRADGTFRIRARHRLRGRLRAVVSATRPWSTLNCRAAQSRRISG